MLHKLIIATIATCFLCVASTGLATTSLRKIPTPAHPQGAASAPAEINHKPSPYYVNPDFFNMRSNNHLTILSHYPTYQQTTEETCGGAALLTVLQYLGNAHQHTEATLTKSLETKPYPIGTGIKGIVNFVVQDGWQVDSSLSSHETFSEYAHFQTFILKNLRAKTPIMVHNVEWGGHWRVIIGYDTMNTPSPLDDILIMADPYDTSDHCQDGYSINGGELFYAMWFTRGIIPDDPISNQWVTIRKPAK